MKKIIWVIGGSTLILGWIIVIFFFSSQPSKESNEQSSEALTIYERANAVFDFSDSAFFNRIESYVFEDLFQDEYTTPNAKVRKSAHFGIYLILGMLTTIFTWGYSKKVLIALLLGITLPTTVAVLDEFNQGLIDRTSSLKDVILDGAGALIGTISCLVIIGAIKFISYMIKQVRKKRDI